MNERRRHVVYVTKNTEYHCRDEECVGVKNLTSGGWLRHHPALRGQLLGAINIKRGALQRKRPAVGLRLVFLKDKSVLTTKVVYAGRPERESILSYTSQCWAGNM